MEDRFSTTRKEAQDEGDDIKLRDLKFVEKSGSWIGDLAGEERIGNEVWERRLKLVLEAFQVDKVE